MTQTHPIVGAWEVSVTVGGQVVGVDLASYGADGTVTVAFPSPTPAPPGSDHQLEFFSTAIGAWAAKGERQVVQRFVSLGVDEHGRNIGRHTITAESELAADGQTWSGPFRIQVTNAAGEPGGEVSGTVTATRIAPEAPAGI